MDFRVNVFGFSGVVSEGRHASLASADVQAEGTEVRRG